MPGIVYNLVKKYNDRFIYSVIKYKSVNYLETATSNTVKLVVADIDDFEHFLSGHELQIDYSEQEETELINRMRRIFKSKVQRGDIDEALFLDALDELQVGDEFNTLRSHYSTKVKNKKAKEYQKKLEINREERRKREEKQRQIEEQNRACERQRQIEEQNRARERQRQIEEQNRTRERQQQEALRAAQIQKALEIQKNGVPAEVALLQLREKWRKEKEERDKLNKERQHQFLIEMSKRPVKYEEFCAFISKPKIRKLDNSPKKVFDVIEVYVGLTQGAIGFDDRLWTLLELYKQRIIEDVFKSVSEYPGFIKYGVPVEYLDVDKMTLNVKGRTLFILLKLKDSDKQNENG